MSEAVKAYIFYKSPLKTRNGKLALGIIVAVMFGFAVMGRAELGVDKLIGAYPWVIYSVLGSLATYLIFWFLDRKKGIGWLHLLIVLSVAFESAFIAVIINNHSPFKFVTVGFNEEFFKILPVLLLVIFLPNVIRNRKDGLIYGGLAGLGFNIIEIAVYITSAISGGDTTIQALWSHSSRLAILGFGSHIIWSAFVGFGLGLSVESTKKGIRKWLPFIGAYLLMAIAHSVYDLGLSGIFIMVSYVVVNLFSGSGFKFPSGSEINEGMKSSGPVHQSLVIEHYLYNFIIILIMIWQILKTAAREQVIYVKNLMDESVEIVSEKEKTILKKEGKWTKRKYSNYSTKVSGKIVKLQNLLAMQKETIARDGETGEGKKVVELLRKEIKTLRAV